MTPSSNDLRATRIFADALELAPEDRPNFLAEACAGDPELRGEVESLLEAYPQTESFFDHLGEVVDAGAESIFKEAVDRSPRERESILSDRCSDDAELRSLVERLLDHHDGRMGRSGRTPALESPTEAIIEIAPTNASDAGVIAGSGGERMRRIIAHYEILEKLGAGGMGEVYRARDLALGREVALKVLPPGFSPAVRDRLLREAWASAKVQHPAIATFYDAGHSETVDYIAMEYVRGRTLRQHMSSQKVSLEKALEITAGVLEALVHAHFAGVLHRDIKPENIMLNEEGAPKLLDFGLARAVLAEAEPTTSPGPDAILEIPRLQGLDGLTRDGAVMGTPGYMPLEQLEGTPVDERADVFAVGAVLYEMICGRPAFGGKTIRARMEAVFRSDPPPIPAQDAPSELSAVVMRSLARERRDRLPSASAFLRTLRDIVGGMARAKIPVRVALLELQNRSGVEDLDWVGTAIAERLVSILAQVPALSVVPPGSVMAAIAATATEGRNPLAIGRQLGCTSVFSGTYEVQGDEILTRTRLIDIATGQPDFDEEAVRERISRVADLAHRLATKVATAHDCKIAIVGGEPPRHEAYECFARARRLFMRSERGVLEEARVLLERAVELEPGYTRALASLAQLHGFLYSFTSDPRALEKGEDYGLKAVEADPSNAEAHLWWGYVLELQNRAVEAMLVIARASELDPSDSLAAYFAAGDLIGHPREDALRAVSGLGGPSDLDDPFEWLRARSLELLQRSVRLNPNFAFAWLALGWHHLRGQSYEEARWCIGKAIELEPTSMPRIAGITGYLGECQRQSGNLEEARQLLQKGLEAVERSDFFYRDTFRGLFLCGLGRTALQQGDTTAAVAAFNQAILHLQGRAGARCGGHVMVQALAGNTRATGELGPFEEAVRLFESREGYDFSDLWGCTNDVDLLELARAAHTLGREDLRRQCLERACACGSVEARAESASKS